MHFSHLFNGRITRSREKKIDRVLKPFKACVVTIKDTQGYRGWIESPNKGFPFDRQREKEMSEALRDAGLYPIVVKDS